MKYRPTSTTRLLIAEDDLLIRRSLVSAARIRGFIVAGEATTGPEAVDQALTLQPDAILMDIGMPGFSGLEATRRIQSIRPTPTVIVTGHDSPDLPPIVADSGAGAYLLKPTDPIELECAVAIAMARHDDLLELKRLVQQKELLVREVYHRIANQLGATASILYLQAQRESHPEARTALFEGEQRVRAMAKVHTLLQEVKHPSRVLLSSHLSAIALSVIRELRPDLSYRESLPAEPLSVPPSIAMTCGLLSHELIMNSIRHAFPSGRQGTITLSLSRPEPGLVRLAVEDDGIGMPRKQPPGKSSSLGLMIVSALCADLGGTLTHPAQESGTATLIEFPNPPEQESP